MKSKGFFVGFSMTKYMLKKNIAKALGFVLLSLLSVVLCASAYAKKQAAELVIVDDAVSDKQVLYSSVKPGVVIRKINSQEDGLQQLSRILSDFRNVTSLHIVSHASDGKLLLGRDWVSAKTVQDEKQFLTQMKAALTDDADVLFYGCNLASGDNGKRFIAAFAEQTGTDVAASSNLTGAAAHNGDWALELSLGDIQTQSPFLPERLAHYTHVLQSDFSGLGAADSGGAGYKSLADTNLVVSNDLVAAGGELYWNDNASSSNTFVIKTDGVDAGAIDVSAFTIYSFVGAGITLNSSSTVVFKSSGGGILRTMTLNSDKTLSSSDTDLFSFFDNDTASPVNGVAQIDFVLAISGCCVNGNNFSNFTFKNITYNNVVAPISPPSITSATYDASTNMLVVSGVNFQANGSGADVDVSLLTVRGQANGTRSLTTSADVEIDSSTQFSVALSGADVAAVEALLNTNGLSSSDAVTYNLAAADDYITYVINGDTADTAANSITVSNVSDSNGSLTSFGGVTEPVGLASTIDTSGEAVDLFDFSLSDGSGDGLGLSVSQIVLNVSGTTTDAQRGAITWRLTGPDVSAAIGSYNSGANTITFTGLSISIADGASEAYTVSGFYNDNTGITEDATFILSVDGDTDLIVSGSGTQMGATTAVNNGVGGTLDVIATTLAFTTQPAGSVSGAVLTTQPVVTAQDAFGNTDVDFTETVTLTEGSGGALTGSTQNAVSGIATFSALTYFASADQEAFTLTADDQSGVGTDLATANASAVTSDVVATQLAFSTQPAPLSMNSGVATSFTTVPVVVARDSNGITDTGYSTSITIAEVNGAGAATMSVPGTDDIDGSTASVTLTPTSGVATYTGMQITYTASGSVTENFNLQATSGALTAATSSQLTGVLPDVDGALTEANGVIESTPLSLPYSTNTYNERIAVFDFTISDGGAADGLPLNITEVVLTTGGTSASGERVDISWILTGPDVSFGYGMYIGIDDSITFDSLSISVADGDSEVYTVSAYYNNNSSLTHGHTVILSLDGDTNVTVAAGTQMGVTSPVTNGTGLIISDDIAPAVTSVAVPANSTYTESDNLNFTVNFDDIVTVNTSAGTPRLVLTVGAATRYASYVSGSGTSALVFRYTVGADEQDADGIGVSAALDPNSGTLRDSVGNDIDTTLNSLGSLAGVLVDARAPTVAETTAVVSPTNDSTPNVMFSVDEAGILSVGGSCGSVSEGAVASGNNTIALTQPDNATPLVAGTYSNCTVTVTDSSGNTSNVLTLSSFTLDFIAPTVAEVTAVVTPGNDASPAVTFSTTEVGTLAVGGSCGSSDEGAVSAGNNTITLTQPDNSTLLAVGTYGDCTITVTDSAGNASSALTLSSFTIDVSAPTVTEITAVVTPTTNTTPSVTISSTEDGTLAVGGSCGSASEGAISSGNTTITLTQTNNATALAEGTYSDCTVSVTDATGNVSSALTLSSFEIDLTAPTVTEVIAVVSPANDATPNVTISSSSAGTLAVGGSCGSGNEGAIAAGNTTITLTQADNSTGLADGAYNDCNVLVTDAAGNASTSVTLTAFIVDVTAPSVVTNSGQTLDKDATGIVANTDLAATDNNSSAAEILFTLVAAPPNGSLNNNGISIGSGGTFTQGDIDNNRITYNHDGSETTSDAFTFTVSDSLGNVNDNGGSNFTYSVTITSVNDAPIAGDDAEVTNEDAALMVAVLANDSDSDNALNAASVTIVSAVSNGSTAVNTASGVITYTPDDNFNGDDSFTYTVEDVSGLVSNVATVSITVIPQNDPPVAVADLVGTNINTLVSIDVAANDTDIDDGDVVDPTTIAIGVVGNGSAVLNGATNQVDYTPNTGFTGTEIFTYTIKDSTGATSNAATVSVNVVDPNILPTAQNDSASTAEDTPIELTVLSNDSDTDGSIVASTVAVMTLASNGTTTVNTVTGSITYTPNENFNGSDSFTYTVQDDAGGTSNEATVTLTITSVNDAPVLNNDVVVLQEDNSLNINVLGNDTDVDGTIASNSVVIVTAPVQGSVIVNATSGVITYTPAVNYSGEDSFSYSAADELGAIGNTATVSLTVDSVNDAPLANDDTAEVLTQHDIVIDVFSNDIDVDGTLDASSVVIVSAPSLGSLLNNNDGTVTYTPTGVGAGNDSFTYTVEDDQGRESNIATVDITIVQPPAITLSGTPVATVEEGGTYSFIPVVEIFDEFTAVFSVENLPAWATFDPATGELSGSVESANIGVVENIVITVTDGYTTASTGIFSITVVAGEDTDGDNVSDYQEGQDGTDLNDAMDYYDVTGPELVVPDTVIVDATGLYTRVTLAELLGLAANADDDDIQAELDFIAVDNIQGAACCNPLVSSMNNGSLNLAPGAHQIEWQATDFMGNASTQMQTIHVRPLVSFGKDKTSVEGAMVNVKVLLNGLAPSYPFSVPYVIDTVNSSTDNTTVDGVITSDDHGLSSGIVVFNEGETQAIIPVAITADSVFESDELLVLALDDHTSNEEDLTEGVDADMYDINSGIKKSYRLAIVERNVAPEVTLRAMQNGVTTTYITPGGGSVVIVASAVDDNPNDTVTLDWSFTSSHLIDNDDVSTRFTFDPLVLQEGLHRIQLLATDIAGATDSVVLNLVLIDALPELDDTYDTDGDGEGDWSEGAGDSDQDGIPNYLDNITLPNVVPQIVDNAQAFLIECEPGIDCRLGKFALLAESDGVSINLSEIDALDVIVADEHLLVVGGVVDFEGHELAAQGQQLRVVIPQTVAIPDNGVYRKFQDGEWRDFRENDNNLIQSSAGRLGFCPPPGDVVWEDGLVPGYFCVQLTIEDGGANDADGDVNGSVSNLGAVSVRRTSVTHVNGGGGGALNPLAILLFFGLMIVARKGRQNQNLFCLGLSAVLFTFAMQPSIVAAEPSENRGNQNGFLAKSAIEFWGYTVKNSQSEEEFSRGLNASGFDITSTTYDASSHAFRLSYGYEFHKNNTIFISYVDLGEAEADFTVELVDGVDDEETLRQGLAGAYPLTANGVSLTYRYSVDFAPKLTGFAEGGVFIWDGKINASVAGVKPKLDDGVDLTYSVGGSYSVARNVDLQVSYLYQKLNDQHVSGVGVGVKYQFE